MLKTAFQILSETAKASYFSEWFNDNVFVETIMFEGSKLVGKSKNLIILLKKPKCEIHSVVSVIYLWTAYFKLYCFL